MFNGGWQAADHNSSHPFTGTVVTTTTASETIGLGWLRAWMGNKVRIPCVNITVLP